MAAGFLQIKQFRYAADNLGYLIYDPNCLHSRLAQERKINPYMRFNDPAIVSLLKQKHLPMRPNMSVGRPSCHCRKANCGKYEAMLP